MLMWVLKLPLVAIAIVAAMRLLCFKFCFHAVEAECVSSDLNDKDGFEAYRTIYKFTVCENNIIDTVEHEVLKKEMPAIGSKEKMLVRKGNSQDIRQMDCVWNTMLLLMIPVCLLIAI